MLARASSQLLPLAWAASRAVYPAIVGATAAKPFGRAISSWRGYHTTVQTASPSDIQKRFAGTAVLQDDDQHQHGKAPTSEIAEEVHSLKHTFDAPHPTKAASSSVPWLPADVQTVMKHHAYPKDYLESIKPKHLVPEKLHEKLAYRAIQTVRYIFDRVTGYTEVGMTEQLWLRRIIFLETVAGVPGMVGGMFRHLRSLRLMRRDNGWINTLLEEAENERMHLLTFMEMRKPGIVFRGAVIGAQAAMMTAFSLSYIIKPEFCHALVGYLEEEAVKTYTHALRDIDEGKLWPGKPAPPIAISYWWLPEDATMRDLILAVRADEACHSHVNHTFARIPQDGPNPFTDKDSHLVP